MAILDQQKQIVEFETLTEVQTLQHWQLLEVYFYVVKPTVNFTFTFCSASCRHGNFFGSGLELCS